MKGHKANHHRKGRAEGGMAEGTREYEEDLKSKTPDRVNDPEINKEADERKHGGRAKRKRGGMVHHEAGKHLGHAKHVGMVHGEMGAHHAGRKPRKAGGRAGSDQAPFSSARKGEEPRGHRDNDID